MTRGQRKHRSEMPREVAIYDGREHLGTVSTTADGCFIATLPDGNEIGLFEDHQSARDAIMARSSSVQFPERQSDRASPSVGGVR